MKKQKSAWDLSLIQILWGVIFLGILSSIGLGIPALIICAAIAMNAFVHSNKEKIEKKNRNRQE